MRVVELLWATTTKCRVSPVIHLYFRVKLISVLLELLTLLAWYHMRSMVYVTVRCPRLSVCPVYLLLQQRAAGLLLSATRAVRYRSTAAGAQQQRRRHNTAHSNAAVNSKCEQCHVYSRRSRLNARLVSI